MYALSSTFPHFPCSFGMGLLPGHQYQCTYPSPKPLTRLNRQPPSTSILQHGPPAWASALIYAPFSLTFKASTLYDVRYFPSHFPLLLSSSMGLLPGRQTYVFDKSGKCVLSFNDQMNAEMHVTKALSVL